MRASFFRTGVVVSKMMATRLRAGRISGQTPKLTRLSKILLGLVGIVDCYLRGYRGCFIFGNVLLQCLDFEYINIKFIHAGSYFFVHPCDLHIYKASLNYKEPLYVQLNVTDGANDLLTSQNFKLEWGDSATTASTDSKLQYDLNVNF